MLASILLGILPLLTDASPVYKRYTSQRIQSVSQKGQCLSPVGWPNVTLSNGVQVGSIDCDQAPGWDISPGSGSITLSGTNYALDAGTGKDNNEIVKIWQSYPGLFQQTWYLTPDSRIAITGGNQCLDQGPVGPQTYQCTTGNTNQAWILEDTTPTCSSVSTVTVTVTASTTGPVFSSWSVEPSGTVSSWSVGPSSSVVVSSWSVGPSGTVSSSTSTTTASSSTLIVSSSGPTGVSSSSSSPTTVVSSSSGPSGPTPTGGYYPDPSDPAADGQRLRLKDHPDLCVSAYNVLIGSKVTLAYCLPSDDANVKDQLWDLPTNTTGPLRIHGTTFCAAPSAESNGAGLNIQDCDALQSSSVYSTFAFENNTNVALTDSSNFCLDVSSSPLTSSPVQQTPPFQEYADLQLWTCSVTDPNQLFSVLSYRPIVIY